MADTQAAGADQTAPSARCCSRSIASTDVRVLVGRNVRRFRKQVGLSQEELAHRAELDRTYISGVERGVRNPTVLVLQNIASALKIEPADLNRTKAPAGSGERKADPRKP